MRASSILGALAIGLAGCATIGTPHAPVVTTPGGQRCVAGCKSMHERCIVRANQLVANGTYWSFANPERDACDDRLGECYRVCPKMTR